MTHSDYESKVVLLKLRNFELQRVLSEDPASHSISLLGTSPSDDLRLPTILRIERTPLSSKLSTVLQDALENVELIESTDIYSWLLAWFRKHQDIPDAKINIICPATEAHIRKYSSQSVIMVKETPELYEQIVKPYIAAFPPSRTQWVENILTGFLILPDMKWDLTNISTLYLVALTFNRSIRSLRDLRKEHIPMLKNIQKEASRIVRERWGMGSGSLRFYVHYQPSYYHFHVHIVNSNYVGLSSMSVGQAHLLEDLVSLLELSEEQDSMLLQRMTFTYGLGEQHGLFERMRTASR